MRRTATTDTPAEVLEQAEVVQGERPAKPSSIAATAGRAKSRHANLVPGKAPRAKQKPAKAMRQRFRRRCAMSRPSRISRATSAGAQLPARLRGRELNLLLAAAA